MRIRLQDVAVRAGVSEATVSRVMNGRPAVATTTRRDVLAVLAEMGYVPPGLRGDTRAGLVGLMLPELDNPVFPAYAQALEARLLARGYVSVLCCAGRLGASEDDYVPTLLDHGAVGLVVVSGRHADVDGDHDIYRELLQRRLPIVFVNGNVDGLDIPSVSADEGVAAGVAVDHLVQLGHERIGFLTGPTHYLPVVRRLAGFRTAMAAAGLEIDPSAIASSTFTVAGGRVGAQQLLVAGMTGIVASSDVMALGAIRAARETGLDVPADVSVVGYDDTELMAYTDPPLTTVRQPVDEISEHTVELLLAQIEGRQLGPSTYEVRPDLVVRGSTARRRTVARAER
jgi:LacI family transcriptional regulator, repressor for deo operon, udp, cdd, tsx, nupC, and nupG